MFIQVSRYIKILKINNYFFRNDWYSFLNSQFFFQKFNFLTHLLQLDFITIQFLFESILPFNLLSQSYCKKNNTFVMAYGGSPSTGATRTSVELLKKSVINRSTDALYSRQCVRASGNFFSLIIPRSVLGASSEHL